MSKGFGVHTMWLIISAMAFGGIMEFSGLLARLIQPLIKRAKHDRSLLVYTGLTAIGINVVAADQYMAIIGLQIKHTDESAYQDVPKKKRLHGVAGHSIDEMVPEQVIDDVI